MADIRTSVQNALKIDGCLGAALVDYKAGMCLATAGHPASALDHAASGHSEVVRVTKKIRDETGLGDPIEEILITVAGQYHLLRMIGTTLYFYVALDRQKSNLATARRDLEILEKDLDLEAR